MGTSNIQAGDGISQGSFDIDLSKLNAPQVDPNQTPGSAEPEVNPIQVEIDPRYKGLPEADAIARTIQSKYDKLNMDFINAQKELQASSVYKEILADLYEKEDALYAFLNERKPELINSRDIKTELKKALTTKFGEGFKPTRSRDEAEREDPGGTDWLYYKELDKLTAELTSGSGSYAKHKSLKEFRDTIKAQREAEDREIEQEISQAKQKYQMPDAEVDWTRKWSATLKFADLVEIARFLRRFQNSPAMASIPGSNGVAVSQSRKEFLETLK